MKSKFLIPVILSASFFIACNRQIMKGSQQPSFGRYIGNYVTPEYAKRAEGYDWIVVTLDTVAANSYQIEVRSRIDRKKATCTYTSMVAMVNDSTLKADNDGKTILFTFKHDEVTISTEKDADRDILRYFCSGGGSLAGSYQKLNEPLDESQLLAYDYRKSLTLQGIGFDIKATNNGSLNKLVIEPSGLELDNTPVTHEIDGTVTNAEIDDLDRDGSPEVLIYINSAGSGSYGSVIAYSVNNKKSMSQIAFPGIAENVKANKGYMGHDEFAIVETSFAQRFPVYQEKDSNARPTGGMRQIQYKLVNGEACKIFKLVKITEFPAK